MTETLEIKLETKIERNKEKRKGTGRLPYLGPTLMAEEPQSAWLAFTADCYKRYFALFCSKTA